MRHIRLACAALIGAAALTAAAADALTVTHPLCADFAVEGFCRFPFRIDAPANIANAVVVVEAGTRTPDDVDLQGYLTTGSVFPSLMFGMDLNMNFPIVSDDFKTRRWTMITIGVNASNNIVETAFTTFFTPENDAEWEDCARGDFATVFDGGTATVSTTMQRRRGYEGQYRILYSKSHESGTDDAIYCNKHPHYVYVNAADPSHVYVEESPLGVEDLYAGHVIATSVAGTMMNSHEDAAEAPFGTFTDGKIVFPAGALARLYLPSSTMRIIDSEVTLFTVTEEIAALALPATDEAEPLYYDLQGRAVRHPRHGEMYIVRQGENTYKTIY